VLQTARLVEKCTQIPLPRYIHKQQAAILLRGYIGSDNVYIISYYLTFFKMQETRIPLTRANLLFQLHGTRGAFAMAEMVYCLEKGRIHL